MRSPPLRRIDVAVNNAGVAGARRAPDAPLDEWRWNFNVKVGAVWWRSRAAARKMITNGSGGGIVNAASVTASCPDASVTPNSASKEAVEQLTKATP